MSDFAEIDKRVSVLEVEYKNMRDALKSLESNVSDHVSLTLQIKEKLDKQNGLIPYMSDSIKLMASRQEDMMKQIGKEAVQDAGTRIKLKIIWAIMAAIGMGVLGYVLKSVFG